MRKTFVALSALVVGGGLAATANAQTVPTTGVTYSNAIQGAVDAQSTNFIHINIAGTVKIKGTVEPNSIGQALVDGKQLLNDNDLVLLNAAPQESGNTTAIYDNDASLGAGAFSGASGNVGINIAAGDNMAQDNAVAIGTVQSSNQGLKADVVKLQEAIGNLFNDAGNTNVTLTNDATIGSGAFNGASGNIGANVAAGAHIGQQNSLAVSVAAAAFDNIALASANVGVIQLATGNVAKTPSITNNATAGDIGNGAAGNLGINVAAGTNILQNNVLAVTAVK